MTVIGVDWDTTNSSPTLTRIGKTGTALADKITNYTGPTTAGTAFNAYAPWGDRRRVNLWDDGTVTAAYGDRCYTDTDIANMGQCMVEIPKHLFYVDTTGVNGHKRFYIAEMSDAGTTIDLANGSAHVLSATTDIHPAFLNNGVINDYIYVGTYEGYSTGAVLQSLAGVQASIAANKNIGDERALAQATGTGYGLTTLATYALTQLAMIIEYATFQFRLTTYGILSDGIGYLTDDGSHKCASYTGHTTVLGNTSGDVPHTNEVLGVTANAMSYRGIENFYGNLSEMVDGCNIKYDAGNYIPYTSNDRATFTSATFTGEYVSTGIATLKTTEGYISNVDLTSAVTQDGVTDNWFFLPLAGSAGGNGETYIPYYWATDYLTDSTQLFMGGDWGFSPYLRGPFTTRLHAYNSGFQACMGRLLYTQS